MPYVALRELGLRPWNDPRNPDPEDRVFGGKILMLFPGEWYCHIPPGFGIVDISGNREQFQPGVTDDDIRIGCLAYGLLVKEPERRAAKESKR